MSKVVTSTILNQFLAINRYGEKGLYNMLLMRPIENTYYIDKGKALESALIGGEIPQEERIGVFQVYNEKDFHGYTLRGFCDILGFDEIIYDIKYKENYKDISFSNSVQHLIYCYLFDCSVFKYLIWDKTANISKITHKDIYSPMYEETYTVCDANLDRLHAVIQDYFNYINQNLLLKTMHTIYTDAGKISPKADYTKLMNTMIGTNVMDQYFNLNRTIIKKYLKEQLIYIDDDGWILDIKDLHEK